jgi:hypothetical protein
VFSFNSSFVGVIFSETLHSMVVAATSIRYIIYDKGKRLPIIDPSAQALQIENSPPQIALFSKTIRQLLEQFFKNTEMLRRDI